MNVLDVLKKNYMTFLFLFISIYTLVPNNIGWGIVTFVCFTLFAYYIHKITHDKKNIFTILHHYHHDHNNFFSHFVQIILELSIISVFVPLFYKYEELQHYLNPWIICFFILFYSTIHNINYSILHVNHVHELHHEHIHVNIGPDICDVLFGTKHSSETTVENTNHYIPNIVIITLLVLGIQQLFKNDTYKKYMLLGLNVFLVCSIVFLIISSFVIWKIEGFKDKNEL